MPRLRYGYATVFQTVAVGRSPALPNNFSVDTLCKMQALCLIYYIEKTKCIMDSSPTKPNTAKNARAHM